jgi:hypothetical protein
LSRDGAKKYHDEESIQFNSIQFNSIDLAEGIPLEKSGVERRGEERWELGDGSSRWLIAKGY